MLHGHRGESPPVNRVTEEVCGCSRLHPAGVTLWTLGEEGESYVLSTEQSRGVWAEVTIRKRCVAAPVTCGLPTGAGSLRSRRYGGQVQCRAGGGGKCQLSRKSGHRQKCEASLHTGNLECKTKMKATTYSEGQRTWALENQGSQVPPQASGLLILVQTASDVRLPFPASPGLYLTSVRESLTFSLSVSIAFNLWKPHSPRAACVSSRPRPTGVNGCFTFCHPFCYTDNTFHYILMNRLHWWRKIRWPCSPSSLQSINTAPWFPAVFQARRCVVSERKCGMPSQTWLWSPFITTWVTLDKAINQRLTLHIKRGLGTSDIYLEV